MGCELLGIAFVGILILHSLGMIGGSAKDIKEEDNNAVVKGLDGLNIIISIIIIGGALYAASMIVAFSGM